MELLSCNKLFFAISLCAIKKVQVNVFKFILIIITGNIFLLEFISYQSKQALSDLQTEEEVLQWRRVAETPSTPKHMSVLDIVAEKKIQLMKDEINDTSLTNPANFPVNNLGRYIMLNAGICKDVPMIDIIIIVHSGPKNLDRRQRIRDSFAKASLFKPFQIRVAFLLGLTENKTLEQDLLFEHARYNDTIMCEFKDDYHNLTMKGVMGYRWVSQYCANSRFVLKIDDDVLVNMYNLLYAYLNQMDDKKKSIFCNMRFKDTMPIMRTGKWQIQSHIFYGKTLYPYNYCSGFAVLMTTDLMKPLLDAAQTTPFFWVDDIYLFGMLPKAVGGVTYYHAGVEPSMSMKELAAIKCFQEQGASCPIFVIHISIASYWPFWELIRSIYKPFIPSWKLEYSKFIGTD